MIGKLFGSQKQRRPERPSFRPMLESLENRLVPSAADASAAYVALPTDMSNLVASLTARPADANTINTNLSAVNYDMRLLEYSARNFVTSDRLQIDNALIVNGITLVYQGYANHAFIPSAQFVSTVQLGASAIESGAFDFLVTGFFPQTSDDAVLS